MGAVLGVIGTIILIGLGIWASVVNWGLIGGSFGRTSRLMNVVLVFFVFNVVIGLISLPLTNPANADNPGVVLVSIISSILFFLVFIFLQGGAMGMVKDQIKTSAASLAQFTVYGKKFYLRILGLLLLYILIAIGVVLVLALISAGLLLLGDNVITRGIVALIVTAASLGIITFLIYPIYSVVVDDIGPITAIKKGITVTKGNFVKTLSVFYALLFISLIISLVIGFVAGVISIPLGETGSGVLLSIVNSAVQSYIPIVMMIAFMTLYMSLSPQVSSSSVSSSQEGQDSSGIM